MAEVEAISHDVSLFEYKFAIDLREISLENTDPIECTIKFNYDLFGPEEVQYPSFTIPPNTKSQDIPGHFEFTASRQKEEEVKNYFIKNPLKIQVYNKEVLTGTAEIDLSPFFTNENLKMPFGWQYSVKSTVTNDNSDGQKEVGFIEGTFFLEKEECFSCKSCAKKLKLSTIFKHFGHPKNDCEKSYQEEELKAFRTESDKRRKEKKHQRFRITYDPEKRAKLHKKAYDPEKRAKAYDSSKRAKLYQKEKAENKKIVDEIKRNNWKTIRNARDYGVTWGPGFD